MEGKVRELCEWKVGSGFDVVNLCFDGMLIFSFLSGRAKRVERRVMRKYDRSKTLSLIVSYPDLE
jgi:hypothetical protein